MPRVRDAFQAQLLPNPMASAAMPSEVAQSDIQELRRLIPLNGLSERQFEQLCSELRIEEAPKGSLLFRQGEAATEFVYLLSGTVSLQAGGVEMDSIIGGSEAARFALAHQSPRKVSACAKDRVRFVRIAPSLLPPQDDAVSAGEPLDSPPDEPALDWISALLRTPLFHRLPPSNLQALLRRLEEREVKAGEVVCRQDDPADAYYIIQQGQCVLTRRPAPQAKEIRLATLKAYDGFGDDALITGEPHPATVTMASDGKLLRLDRDSFLTLVLDPVVAQIDWEEALETLRRGGQWLDVRLPDAFQQGHPRGARNIPFFSLRMALPSLSRQSRYLLVCDDGKASEAGAFLLLRFGFNAQVLKGGIAALPPEALTQEPGSLAPPGPNPALEEAEAHWVAWEEPPEAPSLPSAEVKPAVRPASEHHPPDSAVERQGDRPPADGTAAYLRQELDSLKNLYQAACAEREAAAREIQSLKTDLARWQDLADQYLGPDGLDEPNDEAAALRSELDMIRRQASDELIALKAQLSETEAENTRLRSEIRSLKAQLALREQAAAADSAAAGAAESRPSTRLAAWVPALLGFLAAGLILAGLLGSKLGRDLLRPLLITSHPRSAGANR